MNGGGRKAAIPGGEESEVEALLRAAQDAVMLKLQANSHLVSSSSSASNPPSLDACHASAPEQDALDADLARRFEALRSRPPPPKRPDAAPAAAVACAGGMEARLAALRGAAGPEKEARVRLEDLGGESSEEDEVEKVMRWATDAARLDVATTGAGDKTKHAEEDKDDKSSVSSEDVDDEDKLEMEMKRRKEMASKNKSKNKWFFF